jgi:hypothetical protein
MKLRSLMVRPFVVAAGVLSLTACRPTQAPEEFDLVGSMSSLQRWTDKVFRAAEAENWPLADFYAHELEEVTDELARAGVVYEGARVSELVTSLLAPAVERLEAAAKAKDLPLFRTQYAALLASCNQCHTTTNYGSITIAPPDLSVQPWAQAFGPAPGDADSDS